MRGAWIRVLIRLEGQRSPRTSGWRSVCEFEGTVASDGASLFGFEASFEQGSLEVGREGPATLWMWALPDPAVRLRAGMRFVVREGAQTVATGEILEGPYLGRPHGTKNEN